MGVEVQKWPLGANPETEVRTVGDFLRAVGETSTWNPKTFGDYSRAFRQFVAEAFDIEGGKARFDYRTGGMTNG